MPSNAHLPAPRRLGASLALTTGLLFTPLLTAQDGAGLQPIGAVERVVRSERAATLHCAHSAQVEIIVLAPDLVRIRARFAGQPAAPDHSWAIARTDWSVVPWTLREEPKTITIATTDLEVVVQRAPLLITFQDAATHRVLNADQHPMARNPKTGHVATAKKLGLEERFYGLGEKAARLEKRRGRFTMWNSDTPGYSEGTDPIYQSIPFYLGWEDGAAYGLFYDNSYRSTFDLGYTGQDSAGFEAEGGEINYYFFAGPTMKTIVSRYTELTGRMPLPPLWALGNQQCRYSYYPDSTAEQIAALYRKHDLPLDVLYLDIHYMDNFRVFTWDPVRFPDPAGLNARLEAHGVKVVTIIDPGVKYQPVDPASKKPGYHVFNEGLSHNYFLHNKDGSLYIGEVWPGKAVFVDYTREDARRWWGGLASALVDQGVDGIWTDMNEPSDFLDQTGARHKDIVFDDLGAKSPYAKHRNLFALNMARATYEGLERLQPDRRPFVITRAGYAGIQRFATVWTGDNKATWESLALNIPMFTSLGLSGEAFVGADVPGFIGRASPELLVRSYQVAFLAPLCRNHAAIDNYDHEPWRFGPVYADIVRKYLQLRYRLLPFLYTTLEEANRTGVPLFRPLVLNFQDDTNTLSLDDQFMIGDALLAAPVLHAGERARDVYLPAGRWFDFWTAAPLEGGHLLRVDAPLDHAPLFVRGGSIIPSTIAMNHVGEKPWNPLRFDIYPDAQGAASGSLYEDDGVSPAYRTGVSRRTLIRYTTEAGTAQLKLDAPVGSHQPPARNLEFILHASPSTTTVQLDGRPFAAIEPTATSSGWFRTALGTLTLRLSDDGAAHVFQLR